MNYLRFSLQVVFWLKKGGRIVTVIILLFEQSCLSYIISLSPTFPPFKNTNDE